MFLYSFRLCFAWKLLQTQTKQYTIERVNIPGRLREIGDQAFAYCASLKEINIPDSVSHIGDNAFYGCESLNIDVNQ